eukprot:SM000058S18471  [mRNA]  locus=s58:62132:64034:- [translate_table: standard]
MDAFQAEDVGLTPELDTPQRGLGFLGLGSRSRHSAFPPRWAPPITYLHLHECDAFSMGIFCFPSSAAIPLHDHPGMTVLSKLLYGSMHIQSYDWNTKLVENAKGATNQRGTGSPRLAELVVDEVLTAPCPTKVLYPSSGGNIHAFTALAPCAVLDVLIPPYSPTNGRHCTYYKSVPAPPQPQISLSSKQNQEESQPHFGWLEEFQPPDDFVVRRGLYKGPQIVAQTFDIPAA